MYYLEIQIIVCGILKLWPCYSFQPGSSLLRRLSPEIRTLDELHHLINLLFRVSRPSERIRPFPTNSLVHEPDLLPPSSAQSSSEKMTRLGSQVSDVLSSKRRSNQSRTLNTLRNALVFSSHRQRNHQEETLRLKSTFESE